MRWDPEKQLESDGECRRDELFYLLDTEDFKGVLKLVLAFPVPGMEEIFHHYL